MPTHSEFLILSFETVSASQVHVLLWTSFVSALEGGILNLSGNLIGLAGT